MRSPWKRLVVGWLAVTVSTFAAGRAWEAHRLGWTDADGAARATSEVRRSFAEVARSLDNIGGLVATQSAAIERAAAGPDRTSEVFALLDAARAESPDTSLTVYSAGGLAFAWSGRPSDLPRSRLTGGRAMFVAPGPLGPRLVSVFPVAPQTAARADADPLPSPARGATVVAERLLPTQGGAQNQSRHTVSWPAGNLRVELLARYEGAGNERDPRVFQLAGPDGTTLLEGLVRDDDVGAARQHLRRQVAGLLLLLASACCALAALPLLVGRRPSSAARFALSTLLAAGCLVAARLIAWYALPLLMPSARTAPAGGLAFRSMVDFCLTAAAALMLVMVAVSAGIHARRGLRRVRRPPDDQPGRLAVFALAHLAAGAAATAIFLGVRALVHALAVTGSVDLLRFSLRPATVARIAGETGLVLIAAAATWLAVTVLLSASLPYRVDRTLRARLPAISLWALPPLAWWAVGLLWPAAPSAGGVPLPAGVAILMAATWQPLARWYRHASQGARLFVLFAGLVAPVLSWYPALSVETDRVRQSIVSTRLAPQAISQRYDLQNQVRRALARIDELPGLADLVDPQPPGAPGPVPTDAAYLVWSQTELSRSRLTSSIELYGASGLLTSRFALNLPEYTSTQQVWKEPGCTWELFEEVSPFGSEERRLLHAGRGICAATNAGEKVVGAIVIHAMLEYGDLPFIAAQSPYVALVRGEPEQDPETVLSRGVDFVVYGWSRRPIYGTGSVWTLDEATFRRAYASRDPFWATLAAGGRRYAVLFANDRGGIYALGYPVISAVGHLVNLAELMVLGGVTFAAMTLLFWMTALAGGSRALSGRDLLREVRASFYRKLFLAFVAAAAIPVLTLAVVARTYLTARLLADVEDAAVRTVAVAQRVVEDYGLLQERGEGTLVTVDDDILVWISRIIAQNVNVFEGADLVATSERSLYASGVLPTRTASDVYRAIVLDRRATYVASERLGWVDYLVAAAPVRMGGRKAVLTVPLTLRQQAIAEEIDDLNRRILLAVVAFILAGSALGYWMAERIADPVRRLQRATARIASGELTARVAVTSSDELRRLVEAFNRMAAELQRQQATVERTHRLEAWADMARQVAHEIKNPLTPIQLSAEHLRRVHADRGAPLSPILDSCVDSILTQVRLLRQIAGEFSSFASSPTPRPVETDVPALVAEVVGPYRAGLPDRVTLDIETPDGLPVLLVDRTLVGRALTNIIENALHAMPGGGTLTVAAEAGPDRSAVALRVTDTGIGMDDAAIARLFEPYFSTKATGTGLGLTIAKRNVELHGGTIAVRSEPGRGTTVTMVLPAAGAPVRPGAPQDGGAAASTPSR